MLPRRPEEEEFRPQGNRNGIFTGAADLKIAAPVTAPALPRRPNKATMTNDELKLQAECFQWHWNTFPEERYLLHANNNNSFNAVKGNQNRAIGVVAGVSDLEYYRSGKVIFVELKTEDGRQSEKQKEFQFRVESEGFRYIIIRSLEEFKEFITTEQKRHATAC